MANTSTSLTDWNINTDIYEISNNINNLQKRYIEDEDETTLSMGIFGFIADTESKKIQIATIMAGQLANEMFPTRANLTKNVLTHAVYHNIEGINATPAKMSITFCIKIDDISKYVDDDNHFFLEADSPIFIDNYEFHFDYDIMITRKQLSTGWSYSAQYIVTDDNDRKIINKLSNITNPYLKQPFIITIGDYEYLGIQCIVRQTTITTIEDMMISDSIIENKTYDFQFTDQLADFNVVVTQNNEEFVITPYLYGANVDDTELYCWYLYISEDTIRITFDSRSFLPQLNSKINIKIWTTKGYEGNFEYLNIDGTSEGLYVDVVSDKYKYKNIIAYMEAISDSENGNDRKSKEELQKLIPKAALSRGSITTEADLNNYFDLINNETNRMVLQKKVDNQLARVWYGYFLIKDDLGNIIPTNTIDIKMVINDRYVVKCNDGRYVLPAGTSLKYNPDTKLAEVIDDSTIPAINTREYFDSNYYYYMTMYNLILCRDPLYSSFYLSNRNYNSYFTYEYVNNNCEVQFIANRFHFERQMLVDQDIYNIRFKIAQSIIDDNLTMFNYQRVTYIDDNGNEIEETITTQNIKVVMVFYKNNAPYRWTEADLSETDLNNCIYTFKKDIVTDSCMDDKNHLRILGLNEVGSDNIAYGYFEENTRVDIYILAKLPSSFEPEVDYARTDLDSIAPGYEDYTITNIYKTANGISFFENYTDVLNTKVKVDPSTDTAYYIYGVPVVGRHYMTDENNVKYLLEAISERKSYIDYCLQLVENNMNIDFKFYNTYGPSLTYLADDRKTFIGHIDLEMKFKVSLKDESDIETKDAITRDIKQMIEDLYETGNWHSSDLIQYIMNNYETRINFIEFVGYNTFGADNQHIIKADIVDPNTVPEFLCVRNILNPETLNLDPCINIETII